MFIPLKRCSRILLLHFPSIQTHSPCRPFSCYRITNPTNKKKLVKALRISDLIAPKSSAGLIHPQNRLQLIQHFPQTPPRPFGQQLLQHDNKISHILDDFLELSTPKEDALPVHGGSTPIENFFSQAVSSCAAARDLNHGVQIHCLAIKTAFVQNVYVGSSLINLYRRCRLLEYAYQVFEEMPTRNVVSWTTLIAGFSQELQIDLCLELYNRMRETMLSPNDFTLASILSACTGSGALGQGKSIHCQTVQLGFESFVHVANALISIYGKCGSVRDSLLVFEKLHMKDVISWNSMIDGYAQHGLAEQAIYLFKEMQNHRVEPDAISFLGVLSSCRHAGLVKEGRVYFDLMAKLGVKPTLDHYACIVDLLGRAGLLVEAQDFIKKMPVPPNAVIWGSLLSSCRLHGSVWIGIKAAESRLLLEPECAATHLQLANLYAGTGYWKQAARIRKLMKVRGLRTIPGYSWIEVGNQVCRFKAEDKSNTRVTEVVDVVDSLVNHMKGLCHVHGTEVEENDPLSS